MRQIVFYGVNISIWLIALHANGVGMLLSLVQAVSGNAILFVFPAIFYGKLLQIKQHKLSKKDTAQLAGIICFGLVAMIGGILSIIMNVSGFIHPPS